MYATMRRAYLQGLVRDVNPEVSNLSVVRLRTPGAIITAVGCRESDAAEGGEDNDELHGEVKVR